MGTTRFCDKCKKATWELRLLRLHNTTDTCSSTIWSYELCITCYNTVERLIKHGKDPEAS